MRKKVTLGSLSVRVSEEATQLVGVAHDVDGPNTSTDDVERVSSIAGNRMTQEQTGRAVDRDEFEMGLRPVQFRGVAEHELRDAIRAEHGSRRGHRLASAIADERRVRVQHRHQLLDVPGGTGVPELPHDLLRFTARRCEARTRVAQPAAGAREDLSRVRLALADAPRDLVKIELEHLA